MSRKKTKKQTYRKTGMKAARWTDIHEEIFIKILACRLEDRQLDRKIGKHIDRQRHRHLDRYTDTQTNRSFEI